MSDSSWFERARGGEGCEGPGRSDFEVRTEVVHRAAVDGSSRRTSRRLSAATNCPRRRKNNGLGDAKARPGSATAERRSKVVSEPGPTDRFVIFAHGHRHFNSGNVDRIKGFAPARCSANRATAARPARRSGPRDDRSATARSGRSDSSSPGRRSIRATSCRNDFRLRPASPVHVQEHRRPQPPQGVRPQTQRFGRAGPRAPPRVLRARRPGQAGHHRKATRSACARVRRHHGRVSRPGTRPFPPRGRRRAGCRAVRAPSSGRTATRR